MSMTHQVLSYFICDKKNSSWQSHYPGQSKKSQSPTNRSAVQRQRSSWILAPQAGSPRSVRGLAAFCPDLLVTQIIFQAIPLSSLVSLKNVKAPRAAASRSVRGLSGFCPDVLVTKTILQPHELRGFVKIDPCISLSRIYGFVRVVLCISCPLPKCIDGTADKAWYEIMSLYYVKSILTQISASRQDRRVLQKSKIIRIEFLSKWGMLQTSK